MFCSCANVLVVEDFETESEFGDDRMSLRSFQSQVCVSHFTLKSQTKASSFAKAGTVGNIVIFIVTWFVAIHPSLRGR